MERTEEKTRDPLWRCFDREVSVGRKLLERVRSDLQRLAQVTAVKRHPGIKTHILEIWISQ